MGYTFRVGLTTYAATGGLNRDELPRCSAVAPGMPVTITYLPENPDVNRPYRKMQLRDPNGPAFVIALCGAIFVIMLLGSSAIISAALENHARRRR